MQTAPVYVTFALPQKVCLNCAAALSNESANIEAIVPGDPRKAGGQVTMIENTVDPTTGTVAGARATMPNADEILWPGTLVTVRLNFPRRGCGHGSLHRGAGEPSRFLRFVRQDGVAAVTPVKVARTMGSEAVLESGLNGGETVVTEGQLLLRNGSKVSAREIKTGS